MENDDDMTNRKMFSRWAATGKQPNQFARKFFMFYCRGDNFISFTFDRRRKKKNYSWQKFNNVNGKSLSRKWRESQK